MGVANLANLQRCSPIHSVALPPIGGMANQGAGRRNRLAMSQPVLGNIERPDTFEAWFLATYEVEAAFRFQLVWLRAQLPGYALLPVPQLVENTPFTTQELTDRAAWQRSDFGRGFQFAPPPNLVFTTERIDASRDLRRLAVALRASPTWQELGATRATLADADYQQLGSVGRELRAALSPDRVDEFETRLCAEAGSITARADGKCPRSADGRCRGLCAGLQRCGRHC